MKKVFVKTNNVKRFITMMNNLQNRAEGVPGMGLVYGEPGLGKTQTINWWAYPSNLKPPFRSKFLIVAIAYLDGWSSFPL